MASRTAVAMALCVGVAGLFGCAQVGGGDGGLTSPATIKYHARELEKQGYSEQAAMLEDGVVDARDYADAFDLLRTCVEGTDAKITDLQTNPVDGISLSFVFEYEDPATSDVLDDCQFRYFTTVDMDYRESHANQMDPVLRDAVGECMGELGFETTGEESTVQDFAGEAAVVDGELTPRGQAASDCVQEQVAELFGGGGFGLN
ncbi:MAG: hypothetical protein LBS27_10070 [Bifidobacteriaceae bacterium]|nr:hypothetical protein [Bifidobacteriaceae bacterium]